MNNINFISNHIGNIEDLSNRALKVLNESDIIYYEEKSTTFTLLLKLGISLSNKKILPYPDIVKSNELDKDILEAINNNKKITFVPEYGNPVIADQCHNIMRLLSYIDVDYDVIPGPSIGSTALAISGIHDSNNFCVIDVIETPLPELHDRLFAIKNFNATIVLIPNNNNIKGILETIDSALGNKKASLCIDLTMPSQRVIRSKVSELIDFADKTDLSKHLCTIVVSYNTR